jgi:hypothetical protein
MFRRWRPVALLAVAAFAASGCGGAAKHTPAPTPAPSVHAAQFCSGLTDKCVTVTAPTPNSILAASGCHIPDVSHYQGHVNWEQAKPHVCGGIFKGGESLSVDSYAADNNAQLTKLHIWHALYWYIRAVGCSAEAAAIAREAHALHVTVVINDLEDPSENAGYGACLPPLEKKAGLIPVDYTSPGTWSSADGGFGAVPLWQAEYGPTLNPVWRPVVAWQCTDGHYGCVTSIPGIGVDDVSVNLGITKLGTVTPTPKPKDPLAAFPRVVFSFNYDIRAGEYRTVKTWREQRCANPVKRPACETLHYHAQLLRDRLVYVAKHEGGYGKYQRGQRLKVLNGIVG